MQNVTRSLAGSLLAGWLSLCTGPSAGAASFTNENFTSGLNNWATDENRVMFDWFEEAGNGFAYI